MIEGLGTILPSAGVAGVLVLVVVHLLRVSSQDRSSYAAQLAAVEAAHEQQLLAVREGHTADIADLRSQLATLRESHAADSASLHAQIETLRAALEEERRARWHAEDEAAAARREADAARQGSGEGTA